MTVSPSFWLLKPWWCQPWSIVATGVSGIAGSWWWLHHWWITLPLSLAVLLWWWVFLVMAPRAYRQAIASGDLAAEGGPGSAAGPAAGSPPQN